MCDRGREREAGATPVKTHPQIKLNRQHVLHINEFQMMTESQKIGIGQNRSVLGAIGAKNRRAYSYQAQHALEFCQCVIGAIGALKIEIFNFFLIAPITH